MEYMQNENPGWRIIDFDWVLYAHTKGKQIIYIHRWTSCTTHCEPAHFSRVGRCRLKRTRIDHSGLLTTWTANLAPVWFQPGPCPKVTVQNRCNHQERCISYSRRPLLRFQLLDLPDIVLLPMSPSHLPESRVSSFGSIADIFLIATTVNSLLQTMISVPCTQGNGAAWLRPSEWSGRSQPSMHRWQDHIATSDRPQKPWGIQCWNARRENTE